MSDADLLLAGGTVLPVDAAGTVIPDGAVAIRDGAIVAVGPRADVEGSVQAEEVRDTSGCLVLPGLINCHTHLAMTLFRGVADDVDLQGFLDRLIAAETVGLTADAVGAGVAVAAAESLLAGTTTALDMYWFPETAVAVADRAGLRLLTGPTFMDIPGPDGRTFDDRLANGREWFDALVPRPGMRPVVMAHSTYTLSPDQLVAVAQIARDHDALLHIHAAENAAEVAMVLEQHGARPVELLDQLGLLGPDTLLAHAVDLTAGEREAIARTGTAVAHCPVSNLKLACGVAPIPELLDAGVRVGLGTDGAVSSNTLELFTAMRMAATVHNGVRGDATLMGARKAVEMATREAAASLGLGDSLGSLEVGKRADVVVVDLSAPHAHPMTDPWSFLAYAASHRDVRDVVVDGRLVVRDGALLTLDVRAVTDEVDRLRAAIDRATG